MDKPKAGYILRDNILIMRVVEFDNFYDLSVVNRDTDESGYVRLMKQLNPQQI